MLTPEDVNQLRKVIREEVEAEAEETRKESRIANMHVRNELAGISDRLKTVEISTRKTEKTVDTMAKVLDRADVDLNRRVTRIEDRLGIPKTS